MPQNKDKSLAVLRRLLTNHISPYRKKIYLAIFFMVIVAICSAAIVRMVEPAVNQVLINHDKKKLIIVPFIILSIYLIKGFAEYFQSYLIKYVGQQILTDIQSKMYQHLLMSDIAYIESQSSGRLISRFTNDIILMRAAVSNMLVGSAKHFLSVLFLIIIMFTLDYFLACFIVVAFPLAIYPIQYLCKKMRKIIGITQEELGNFTSRLDETFYSIRVIKSFS